MSICFELLISPIKPELVMVTVLKANAAETCAQGMEWSDAANRCLVKASTAQTQRDLEACEKLSGEEKTKCLVRNAEKASGNTNVSNVQDLYNVTDQMKGMGAIKTAAYALPLMLFTYLLLKSKKANKGKRCMPPSTIALIAGAAASGAGEVYGWIKHNSNIDKLNEQRDRITQGKKSTDNKDQQKINATELQSEAFQLLADEQKSVAGLAKAKKIFYGAATVAYAGATGIAVYELLSLKAADKAVIAAGKTELKASEAAIAASSAAGATTASTLKSTGQNLEAAKAKLSMAQIKFDNSPQLNAESELASAKLEYETASAAFANALLASVAEIYGIKADQTRAALASAAEAANKTLKAASEARAQAINKKAQLQQKFVCGAPAKTAKLPRDEIIRRISQIRKSKNIQEVHQIIDDIQSPTGFQTFKPDQSVSAIPSIENRIFQQLYVDIVISELQEDYQIQDSELKSRNLFKEIISNLSNKLISSAYANDPITGSDLEPTVADENNENPDAAATNNSTPTETKEKKGFFGSIGSIFTSLGALIFPALKNKKDKGTEAKQDGTASTDQAASVDQDPKVQEHDSKTSEFLHSPKFRIAFGGVLTGLTTFMTIDMGKMQKLAEQREKKLLELKADFNNTQGMKICTPAERNDQKQPGCYCYTADGARNTNRSNSTICQNLWNSVNLNGMSYLTSDDVDSTKVCVTQSNAIDASCECRKTNTCLKATGFNVSGISTGTLSSLNGALSPIGAVGNGQAGTLNTDANLNAAMKLRDATDKLLSSPELAAEKKFIEKASDNLGSFVNKNGGSIPSPSSRSTPSSLANFDAKAALEEIKKDVEYTPAAIGSGSAGGGFDTGSQEPSLEFGLTEDEAAVQEEQVAEVLKQDMDLGNNDISGSTTNLFEVLSHRYQRSGMRRLFDTEGKTEAEKPAATDINK